MKSREQQLIDLLFSVAMTTRFRPEQFNGMSQEQYAAWIRKHLAANGFETVEVGISWGRLTGGSNDGKD